MVCTPLIDHFLEENIGQCNRKLTYLNHPYRPFLKVSESPLSGGSGEHDEDEDKNKDGTGVPNIMLEVLKPHEQSADKALEKGILPTYEEVRICQIKCPTTQY